MSVDNAIGLVIALLVTAYLVCTLIFPEKF